MQLMLRRIKSGSRVLTQLQSYSKKINRIRRKMDENLKCREDPVVVKLDSPEFHNMLNKNVIALKDLFDRYQYEIRIAGGAVRDLLLGNQPKDLDFATTATPQQMKDMFTTENVRLINASGEKHGTITPRINDSENYEVTTLRIDVVTDGRHAEVEFTTDWKLDANRRDLTINSMFLGFDGSVFDYFFGYEDLMARRVAFVGNPDLRIKEDYLRILRYFRFYGRIALKPDNHEANTLKTISENVDGLQNISGERIWTELKKILEGNFAGEIMKTMLEVRIGDYIGLPMEYNLEEFNRVWSNGKHLRIHPMCLLSALLKDSSEVLILHTRLKFSSYDRDLTYFIVENRGEILSEKPLLQYQKMVINSKKKQHEAIEYVKELLNYNGNKKLLQEFSAWKVPRFPVSGLMLNKNGVTGPMCGKVIKKLKDVWMENDFKYSGDDLVKLIPDIVQEEKIKSK